MSIPAFESHNIEIEKNYRELDKSQLGFPNSQSDRKTKIHEDTANQLLYCL